MSRIIESCRQCSSLIPYKDIDDVRIVGRCDLTSYPVFDKISDLECPLPKLDDKMREAWDACESHVAVKMSGKSSIHAIVTMSFDEWRKQNEH